ncbi:MAG: hypothetical protein PVH40_04485, partial [Gemmatimonadales bacterium]
LQERTPGRLITEGIDAAIRHPRYVEVVLFPAAHAFLANHIGTHVVAALGILALYLGLVLEEQELRNCFGSGYEEQCRRVPRFIPAGGSRST